ncbi:MAG: ATP-binding protein [Oscillospiraceae bacterium]|nr:ATP-binding protein [Oscillospiraceae bacterium]
MKFIGRNSEFKALTREYERDSGFVVVYGRRRIGKTTLIKEFIKDKTALYFLATEEIEGQSMLRFAGALAKLTAQPALADAKFANWERLFESVAAFKPDEKKIIVIDEFPYLVKTNPAFPSILQSIWDEKLKDSNVMLILCGSQISMMYKHTLSYDSPLYGRRTAQMRLKPLSFMELCQSDKEFTHEVERYAITGGVPKYLEFFADGRELQEQITETVLLKTGLLYEEPLFLLKDEVREPVNYFSIIKTIAAGNHKIGNIASVLEMPTTKLTPYLLSLIELGFVEKRLPITETNPEKSRKGLYFISDNFTRFWFRYVYPNKGELELDNTQVVLEQIDSDFITSFVAFAYEDICTDIFAKLCADRSIPFTPSKIGSYWLNDYGRQDTQIDVVAIDNKNKRIFVSECKYHEKPVDADVYFNLQSKAGKSKEIQKAFSDHEILYGVFSKSGFTDRLLDVAKGNDSVWLIDGSDVV